MGIVKPNRVQIARYYKALFRYADDGTHVSLRTFRERGTEGAGSEGRTKHTSRIKALKVRDGRGNELIDQAYAEACWAASDKTPWVFCPPVATFTGSGQAREVDLANGLVLSLDLDARPSAALRLLTATLGKPTVVVDSGGRFKGSGGKAEPKLHVYWRLHTPTRNAEAHQHLKEARRLATLLAGGDASNVPLVHPIRWPGSVHRKGKPRLTKIIELNDDTEIDLDRALKKLRRATRGRAKTTETKKKEARRVTPTESAGATTLAVLSRRVLRAKSYHEPLCRMAMIHARHGMGQEAIVATLQALMLAVPQPRRSSEEERARWEARYADIPRLVSTALEKLKSSWRDPEPLPSTRPAVPTLTPDLIPKAFRSWLAGAAERMQVPLDYVVVPALVAAGALVGRRIGIQPKRHDTAWVEVPNQWGCIVGPPAIMKSPGARVGMAPLHALEGQARERNEEALKEHARAMREYEARKKAAVPEIRKRLREGGDISDLIEDPPEPPKLRRYIVVDITQERLGPIHADNPNGLLVHRDELAPFLTRLDRDERADERALFLSGWSGLESHAWDRVGRGHVGLPGVCLSVFGTTQPDRMLPYLKQVQSVTGSGDGLIQRFGLLVWPDITRAWRNVDEPIDKDEVEKVQRIFRRLAKLNPGQVGAEPSAKGVPVLGFSPKAQRSFERWHRSLELRLRSDELPPLLDAHLGKYRKLVPGLALLFHLIEGSKGPVDLKAVKLARRWAAYLEAHARRTYGTVVRADVLGAETLLKHIRKREVPDPFTHRDIQRHGWRNLVTHKEVEAALQVLLDSNIIRRRHVPSGKRQRVICEVNPKLVPDRASGP